MHWREFPPLAGLRAFEAAARTGSYSQAGRELNVSHAAVMQQVRGLERFLGLPLVERSGRGITVTPDGALLADHATRGFEQIESALRLLNQREEDRPVHITMTPSFAISWFMPRMPLFRAAYPDVDLMVNPTVALVDLKGGECDMAIRFGDGSWPGVACEPILKSSFVIVGAPSLLDGWSGRKEDLANLPWIEELGRAEISEWLTEQGIEIPPSTRVTELPGFMVPDAVRNGQAIAATARAFVEDDLANGRLVVVHEDRDEPGYGYHLLTRHGERRQSVLALGRWLRKVAAEGSGNGCFPD